MYSKYLVTGANSQLGEQLVKMLVERGESVRVLIDVDEDASYYEELGVEISRGETFHKDSMREFFTLDSPRSCVLVHADERVSIANGKDLLMRRVNVSGAVNVVDMCIKHKIGRLVYLSSAYALASSDAGHLSGEKFSFNRNRVEGDYAQTKAEASAYVMEKITLNKYNAVLVLPTFMIGPGARRDSDIGKVLDNYLNLDTQPVNGGHVFVDVRDVASGIIAAAEKGETGASYILTGEYRSTADFFRDVCEVTGVEQDKKMFPDWLLSKSVAKFVDTYFRLAHKNNPKDAYALFTTAPDNHYEEAGSMETLEIHQTDIRESIKETISSVSDGAIKTVVIPHPLPMEEHSVDSSMDDYEAFNDYEEEKLAE